MTKLTAQKIIQQLRLRPHPEGGYFRESYRAQGKIPKTVLTGAFKGNRSYSTAIYFLLPKGSRSSFHRILSDEIWHFYLGGPITIFELHNNGKIKKTVLGPLIHKNQKLQYVVPANCWFGAYPNPETKFALAGCTVSPGFDFADFELADRAGLLKRFPKAREEILKLT